MNTNSPRDDKGLSTRHLILIFLAGVAVCGIFFSLGFLVGFNERSVRMAPVTERVSTPATIPPTINSPLETVPVGSGAGAPSQPSVPPPLQPLQASAAPSSTGDQKPATASGTAPPVTAPSPPPEKAESEPEADRATTSPAASGEVGGGFTVQVTALRTKQDAEAVVRILKGRGYPVLLVAPGHGHANDNLFRVQVGPFASRGDAEKMRTKLTQQGFKPFIRH
jgi:cell division septation protein DedD